MKRVTMLLAFWVIASLSLFAQAPKAGWTLYRVNDGAVTLSLPNSMKIYESKEKGFSVTKATDGSYSVKTDSQVFFVPVSDQTDYDKEDDITINNMVVLQISESGDGLADAIKYLKKSGALRSLVGWGLKKVIGLQKKGKEDLWMTDSKRVLVTKVSGDDAISMEVKLKDKAGKEADAKLYLVEHHNKGIILVFLNQKGLPGFTKQDNLEVLGFLRLK